MYDIFVIGNNSNWKKIKSKYPFAKRANDFSEAKSKAITPMFWSVWDDIEVNEDFDFTISVPKWDHEYVHVWKNKDQFDGLALIPKNKLISEKEIKYRFFVDKKEIDQVASQPKKYDIFEIETYDQYLEAVEKSTTDMFWMTSPNLKIVDSFDFSFQGSRYENHAFVHLVNGEKLYNGVFLLSKHRPVSKKEIEYRYLLEKKEWDIVASGPCEYDKFIVDTYDQYLDAKSKSKTEMFWMIPSDITVLDDFKFDVYYSHDKDYERNTHHGFLNGSFYDGVFLVSKNKEISKKEIDNKFIIERKEEEIEASKPVKFDVYYINNYNEYLEISKTSKTNMFWCVWSDVEVVEDFEFDYYVPRYNQHITHVFKNGKYFDGICLFSKNNLVSEKEFKYRFFTEKKEIDYVISYPKQYDKFIVDTYEDYLKAKNSSTTEMFYIIPSDVKVLDDFNFNLYFSHHNVEEKNENHALLNGEYYDGIFLVSKNKEISQKEIDNKFIIERKEQDIVASTPVKFDVYYINDYEDYLTACETSTTNMFWCVWSDVEVVEDFEFDYYVPRYNQHITHVFKNGNYFDGICLFSKNSKISEKEFKYRFFTEKKEIDYVISYPKKYDKFIVDSYDDYLKAKEMSTTEMFYMIPSDVEVIDSFKFDLYFSHHNVEEKNENHALLNGDHYDGIFLVNKNKEISQKEIDNKFIIERKNRSDIFASRPVKFNKFYISTYNDYLKACEESKTNMFWCVWSDVEVVEDFEFDYYVPRYNQHITHVFKNGPHFDGICLFSKHHQITEKEFKYRFFTEKKEIDYVISYPKKYDIFTINSYKDYLTALETSSTEMFWIVPSEVEPLDSFDFDLYFSYHNTYERRVNHSFKHMFRGEETYNGICLMSKHVPVSEKEITFRYLVERKEWDTIASKMKPYDIVFISYNESNADENFNRVKTLYPRVKRVHGVKGIHQAHIKAAEQATTENFWVVDGDAVIVDDFKFDYEIPVWERDTVHVWRSQNPVNDLVYGYGGVKLLPRQLTLNMDVTRPDMTTSISDKFKPVQVISNITAFNTDEFSTWKSAFRECAKLAGKAIDRQVDAETEERLNVWCSEGADKPFGEFAIKGALAGRKFATENPQDLFKINDFDWLYEQYEKDNRK